MRRLFADVGLDQLTAMVRGTMVEHIGIEFTGLTDDTLTARMPVDARTRQPFGILHGGASIALAETLGSVASTLVADPAQNRVVGIEVNGNHLRAVSEGWVIGTCRPIHVGRSTHVWEIRIATEDDRPVCVSRLTVLVVPK